jgi:hypothetical protein
MYPETATRAVKVQLYTLKPIQPKSVATEIFRALAKVPVWHPTTRRGRSAKMAPDKAPESFLDEVWEDPHDGNSPLDLYTRKSDLLFHVFFGFEQQKLKHHEWARLRLTCPEQVVFAESGGIEPTVGLMKDLVAATGAEFAYVHRKHLSGYENPSVCVERVYWANYYGPDYVAFYGRDLLEKAFESVEPFGDGVICRLRADWPADLTDADLNARATKAIQTLGPKKFKRGWFSNPHPKFRYFGG